MNGRPFTRKTVEGYISQGYSIADFIERYDFSDEDDFKNHLMKIDPTNADRIFSKLKNKKTKGGKKKISKTPMPLSTAIEIPSVSGAVFMTVAEAKTPFAVAPKVNLTKILKKAVEETQPEVVMLTDLEKLKNQLSENEKYLSELSKDITEKKASMKAKITAMQDSVQVIKDLEKKIEAEKAKFNSLTEEFEAIESECKEQVEMKKLLTDEIAELKAKIQKLESKKLYFGGTDSKGENDINADDIDIPAIILMNKLQELVNSGKYEDFALGNLRTLAKMLCIITKCSNEYDCKIEVIINKKDYDAKVVNNLKLLIKSKDISFTTC